MLRRFATEECVPLTIVTATPNVPKRPVLQ
jgi:hypothetical protein